MNTRCNPFRRFYWLILLSVLKMGCAGGAAELGPEVYRLGYADAVELDVAVADYNAIHRSDMVASQYPELNAAEVGRALAEEIKKTDKNNEKKRDRLALLAKKRDRLAMLGKCVASGKLPKGSLLGFQYADKNRTRYWHDWGKLSSRFSIILWSGLDENPPETGSYNQDAFILSVVIRASVRKDRQWLERAKK